MHYWVDFLIWTRLERESRLFFDIKYFEECVCNGDWEEAEKYLSRFTNAEDNLESFSIFFEIKRQIIMKHMTSKHFLLTFFYIFLKLVLELFCAIFLIPSVFLVFPRFCILGFMGFVYNSEHCQFCRGDRKMMLDILKMELEVFTLFQADLYRGHVPLFQLNNFRCI